MSAWTSASQKRRAASLATVTLLLLLAVPPLARGQDDTWDDFGGTPQAGGPTPGSVNGQRSGGDNLASRDPGEVGVRTTKRCTSRGRGRRRVRTCRYYRGVRLTKVCTKRSGRRQRCRPARAASATRDPVAGAARLDASGYTNPVLPPVVHFYFNGQPHCSGTVLLRGVILTAAHCLYKNITDGKGQVGYHQNLGELKLTPGSYVSSGGGYEYPHGAFLVKDSYVPIGWTQEDGGLDWGLAVVHPDSSGRYPGDYTGTYAAYWNAYLPVNTRFFNVGYPASGPFATAAWYFGNGQYFCDSTWDGQNTNGTYAYTASSWNIVINPCEMNGGMSGGPVFAQFGDGSWGIIAVNNRGNNRADGFGAYGVSFWLDTRFGEFWNGTVGLITASRAGNANRPASARRTAIPDAAKRPPRRKPQLDYSLK